MSFKHYQHCRMQAPGCRDLGTAGVLWVTGTRQTLCIVPLFQANVEPLPLSPYEGKDGGTELLATCRSCISQ